MKRILTALIILTITFILCGCGNLNVNCSIDSENNVEMKIDLTISKDNLSSDEIDSIQASLMDLKDHWKDVGYSVKNDFSDDEIYISLSKKAKGNDLEDAVNELLIMMGDSSSPFSAVEGGYSDSYLSDIYNIRAEVDLTKIFDYAYIKTIPVEHQDRLNALLESFTGNVSLDLYGTTNEHVGNLDGNINTVDVTLEKAIEIYSLVEIVNEENNSEYNALIEESNTLQKDKQLYLTLTIVAVCLFGVLLLTLIIFLIIKGVKKGKKQKADTKSSKETEEPVDDIDNNENEDNQEKSDK